MSISVTFDVSGLVERFGDANLQKAQEAVADRILTDCTEYVPMETGALRGSGTVEDGGEVVAWTEEYAGYVYNMDGAHFTTPGTGGHWFETAKQSHIGEWVQVVEEAFSS